MPTNDFIPYGTDAGANVISQAEYVALGERPTGFIKGTALVARANKVWRQATSMVAAIGTFIVGRGPYNALDDGNIGNLRLALEASVAAFADQAVKATDVGTLNILVANPDPAKTSLYVGMRVVVVPANTNSGPATLNLSGLGAKAIIRPNGAPLIANDLIAGRQVTLLYDGAAFQLAGLPQAGALSVVAYTTAGTYNLTVPAGATRMRARVWGAGGGGGGNNTTTQAPGGGGGAGGYAEGYYAVTPSAVLSIIVGAGGAGGSNAPGAGSAGGTSSVSSYLSASGGGGGQGPGGQGGSTGIGTGGTLINANGGSAGTAQTFVSGTTYGGGYGGAGYGYNDNGPNISGAGIGGQFPGTGGNSSAANGPGGNGAAGQVLIEFF